MERNTVRSDSASPESAHPKVYSEAFQTWKAAKELFATAVKAYADASAALEALCVGVGDPVSTNTARSAIEEILVALEPELPQISSDLEQVIKTTKSLRVLRNQSTTLVPINRLPPNVLKRIFQSLMHTDPQDPALRKDTWPFPETVAHVSTSWRQISFSDSQLWGRIDIDMEKEPDDRTYKNANARLEYARDSRLDVRIHQLSDSLSIFKTGKTTKFLEQIAPRLGAITCRSVDYYHKDLMADTLISWLQHGAFYTLSELHLFRYRNNRDSRDLRRKLTENLSMVEGWLSSVRYLTLHYHRRSLKNMLGAFGALSGRVLVEWGGKAPE